MDYVKKFLHVEGIIGQGAFGRVLATSPLQNANQTAQQTQLSEHDQEQQHRTRNSTEFNRSQHNQLQQIPGGTLNYLGHLSRRLAAEEDNSTNGQLVRKNSNNNNSDYVARRFALKCVHPILKPQRLANELRHLRDLGGLHNVVQLHTAHFNKGSLYIVMDLFEHDRFMDIVAHLEYEEIVMYMVNLLDALEHVHSKNIMHRDIKPANFLFNRKNKKFLLIDFGLAQLVRTRTALFGNNRTSTAPTPTVSSIQPLSSAPTTPTSSHTRRHLTQLTPDFTSRRKESLLKDHASMRPNININSYTPIHNQTSAINRHLINFTPACSPSAPNVGTKRQSTEVNDVNVNQMMKKLRVDNKDETREPVRLTVGAYESPITNGDGSSKRNATAKNHNFSTPTIPARRNLSAKCDCRGKARTCTTCQTKPDSAAPKSGTPGYKAPEILLRYSNQTTAVDIWSAGVIFACLLSGHTPFFRDSDDYSSLAEMITILGSQRVTQAAKSMSILLTHDPKREPVDLMQLCRTIRLNNKDKRQIEIPAEAFDLLDRMLDPNPSTRITARDALREHAWLKDRHSSLAPLK